MKRTLSHSGAGASTQLRTTTNVISTGLISGVAIGIGLALVNTVIDMIALRRTTATDETFVSAVGTPYAKLKPA